MFRDKGEREATRIQKDLQPYTAMTSEYEILERLHGADVELAVANKHLITSNDRYQFTVARLLVARTKAQIASAIANSVTEQDAFTGIQDVTAKADEISSYLKATFEACNDDIEEADRIASIKGFTATSDDKESLLKAAHLSWPDATVFTPAFVQGSVRALDAVASNVLVEAATTVRAPLLPNNFKQRLSQQYNPLLAQVAAKQKAIERARLGKTNKTYTREMLLEMQRDVMSCIEVLTTTCLWISVPSMFDSYFDLKKPLDELRGPTKPFNPTSLGGTAVQPVIEKPRPTLPHKPFEPEVLQTPVDNDPVIQQTVRTEQVTKKEFDPSILGAEKKQVNRPFDPSDLN